MMHDPVCGMEIDLRQAAAMALDQGYAYYFCCAACQEKFIATPERYRHKTFAQRLTVGVMGSAGESEDAELSKRVFSLGEAIVNFGLNLITGACPGLPYECAQGVRARGGLSIGISPALSLDEHIHKYHSPTDAFDILVYTGSGLMGREVTNIRSSDMVIIAGGRSGTLGEFAIAYDEGKLIGVLQDSGGITAEIPNMVARFDKDTGARMIYEADPTVLVKRLTETYVEQHFQQPSCFCNEALPAEREMVR